MEFISSKRYLIISVLAFVIAGFSGQALLAQTVRYPRCQLSVSSFEAPQMESCKCPADSAPLYIPDAARVQAIQTAAREEIKEALFSGRITGETSTCWDLLPNPMFTRCDFRVPSAFYYDKNGNRVEGAVCAAGVAIAEEMKIVISTRFIEDVEALIRWETLNVFLMRIGREDLADRWTTGYSDRPLIATTASRRRAAKG